MEDIDFTIKQRLEIVKIEERQKEALKELDNLILKIEKGNLDLQKVRDLEEKLLAEIEKEANERVKMAMLKLGKAGETMADLERKATLTVSEVKNSSKRAQDGILGLLSRAKELVDKADTLKTRSEEVMATIAGAEKDLNEKIIANSEFEATLKKREKEVKIKSEKAEEKLKEIKDLVFWHKQPESKYTQK